MKKFKLLFTILIASIFAHSTAQDYYVLVSSGFAGSQSGVKQFDQNGNFVADFVDPGAGSIAWPQDILFLDSEDKVIVSGLNSNAIHSYNINNGEYLNDFDSITNGPTRMSIGPDGLIYVLQWNNTAKVLRYNTDGSFVDEFTSIGINQAIGMDWDAAGNFYVSSYGGNTITQFDSTGNNPVTFISGLQGPTNIWFDPSGNGDMLVANWNGNKVQRYDASGTFINDFISNIVRPEGVAYLPNGNFLMGSAGTVNSVFEFESDGTPVGLFASGNNLANPNAIVIRDVNLFSVSENNYNPIFVTPTIGNSFKINQEIITQYDNIKVFNNTGALIETLNLTKGSWEASSFAEGIYFMVGSSKKGIKSTQKIIVKK